VIAGVLVVVIKGIVAFFTLDLSFRYMDLAQPRRSLRRTLVWYTLVAGVTSGLGLWVAWRMGGLTGLLITLSGVPLWWILWRFGLRKQFPYIFFG